MPEDTSTWALHTGAKAITLKRSNKYRLQKETYRAFITLWFAETIANLALFKKDNKFWPPESIHGKRKAIILSVHIYNAVTKYRLLPVFKLRALFCNFTI
jgi:hypothetical protein